MSTHNIPLLILKQKIILSYPQSSAMELFQGLKNELEIAVVNELSEFEPLKFYCTSISGWLEFKAL